MANKLSEKSKKLIINGIIVSAIMLFIIGFIIGKLEENQKETNEKDTQSETIYDGFSYSDLESESNSIEESEGQDEEIELHHHETDNPELDFDEDSEREVALLEDYYEQNDIELAREVAEAFVNDYYSFNGDKPLESINKSLRHVTNELEEELTGFIPRPSFEYYKMNIKELSVYEPYNPSGEKMELSVRVNGEVLNMDGNLTKEEVIDYHLELIPVGDTYKVNKYTYESLG